MLSDLRLAVRHLLRAPGFTIAATLTLALAIGANSAIFSAVNAVLIRPLPVRAPDEVVVVWQNEATTGQAVVELTHRHLREWMAAGTVFSNASLMGSHNWPGILEGAGEPVRVWYAGVSASFFEVLGVTPFIGRPFNPADDRPGAAPVVAVNHSTWMNRFSGDRSVIGRTITVDGRRAEIVSVMPPGVDLPRAAEFWTPAVSALTGFDPENTRILDTVGVFYVIGRPGPGVTPSTLGAAIDALEARLDATTPGRLKWGDRAVVTPLLTHVFGPTRPALWALWAAVTVLLLIACANVSGLLLTRVAQRQREHAVRLALGATRFAVGRVWVLEVLLVTFAGGVLGFIAASRLSRLIVALAPDDLPRLDAVNIDTTVALFTFGVVLAVALAVGAMPIRQAGVARIAETLAAGGRATTDRRSMRARSGLLMVQMSLAVLLLVAAGLVTRSFVELKRLHLGFDPVRVLSVNVLPQSASIPTNEWMTALLERVRTIAGVEAAGAVALPPLALGPIGQGVRVVLQGQPETAEAAARNPTLNYQVATPGYLEAMGIRLVQGRWFNALDAADAPRVSVVSESTARRLWPGEDPIGQRVRMANFTPGKPGSSWRQIVGVVADVRHRDLEEVQLDIYDPALQVGQDAGHLIVRAHVDPNSLLPFIRQHARALDARVILDRVTTLEAVVARASAPWRFSMWLFALLAAVSFALAAVGLFSVVALDVIERRHEFAVRLALGASSRQILRTVLFRFGVRVAIGAAAGLLAALMSTQVLRSLLFQIGPHDPATYVVVIGVVALASLLAAYVPARRAAATSLQTLLR